MKCVALTVFTNDALSPKASHEEVLERAKERSEKLSKVIREGIKELPV
jgi:purine nucleoside phosphorylase